MAQDGSLRRAPLFICCVAASLASAVYATAPDIDDFKSIVEQKEIFLQSEWLSLLHYRLAPNGRWISEADSERFFFAVDGATNPRAEMLAFIDALRVRHQVHCAYPARTKWLRSQGLPLDVDFSSCPKYAKWRKKFSRSNLSLVFATASMDDPASMFGHSFIRIYEEDVEAKVMGSATLNYYAEADGSLSLLKYVYRGFAGGFWGVIDDQDMFRRVREYSDNQARDMWEFELKFDADQISRIIDHAWEIRDKAFRYYFIDDNCGYRTLRLLAVADPDLLPVTPRLRSLPVDSIKELAALDIIGNIRFIPSVKKQYDYKLTQLTPVEKNMVSEISKGRLSVDSEQLGQLSVQSQAKVLSLVMSRMSARIQRGGLKDAKAYATFDSALSRRLELDQPVIFSKPPSPNKTPLNSHDATRLRMGTAKMDDQSKFAIDVRFVGHDLLDPPSGYPLHASLDFLSAGFSYYGDQLSVESLTLLEITSITPTSEYAPSYSWRMTSKWSDRFYSGDSRKTFAAGGGYGYSFDTGVGVLSGLVSAEFHSSSASSNFLDVEAGVDIALTKQHSLMSYRISYRYGDYIARPIASLTEVEARVAVFPARNLAIELGSVYSRSGGFEGVSTRLMGSLYW